jgi:hypothetical protein
MHSRISPQAAHSIRTRFPRHLYYFIFLDPNLSRLATQVPVFSLPTMQVPLLAVSAILPRLLEATRLALESEPVAAYSFADDLLYRRAGNSSNCAVTIPTNIWTTCDSLITTWNTTLANFAIINPSVNSDCSGFVPGTTYCLSVCELLHFLVFLWSWASHLSLRYNFGQSRLYQYQQMECVAHKHLHW